MSCFAGFYGIRVILVSSRNRLEIPPIPSAEPLRVSSLLPPKLCRRGEFLLTERALGLCCLHKEILLLPLACTAPTPLDYRRPETRAPLSSPSPPRLAEVLLLSPIMLSFYLWQHYFQCHHY